MTVLVPGGTFRSALSRITALDFPQPLIGAIWLLGSVGADTADHYVNLYVSEQDFLDLDSGAFFLFLNSTFMGSTSSGTDTADGNTIDPCGTVLFPSQTKHRYAANADTEGSGLSDSPSFVVPFSYSFRGDKFDEICTTDVGAFGSIAGFSPVTWTLYQRVEL